MEFKTKDQCIARSHLIELLGCSEAPFSFRADRDEVFIEPKAKIPSFRPSEIALITIQKNGSAPADYRSISKYPVYIKPLYVAGYNSENNCLVVGNSIMPNGRIRLPFNLRIADMIGYETKEELE